MTKQTGVWGPRREVLLLIMAFMIHGSGIGGLGCIWLGTSPWRRHQSLGEAGEVGMVNIFQSLIRVKHIRYKTSK